MDLNVGICVKNLKREVLSQNQLCIDSCDNMIGKICDKGCMNNFDAEKNPGTELNEGMTLIKNSPANDGYVDAVVINDGQNLTTLIYPLENKLIGIDKASSQLSQFGLTKSEVAIFKMVMQGTNNNEICKVLFISRATLKTHLNNIYKKLPIEWHHYKKR